MSEQQDAVFSASHFESRRMCGVTSPVLLSEP